MRLQKLTVCVAVMSLVLLATSAVDAQNRFEWDEVIASGKTLEIKGINGSIEASAASGNRAELVATKSSREGDVDEVRIEVIESDGNYTICAVHPSSDSSRPNECRSGEGGRMSVRNSFEVTVDFTLRVPSGVRFVARNVNGSIDAEDLDGEVEASTVNGSINILASGVVRARTVNGSIEAAMGRADWNGRVEFESVNGEITVEIPDGVSTRVEAETVMGGISTDFPLTVSGRFGPRRITGTIQGDDAVGNRELHLKTVNGAIRLRSSS